MIGINANKVLMGLLLLWTVMVMAEPEQSIVPAMIVYCTDGSRRVVALDDTDVTDLIVLQTGQSLSVDIPESQNSGVRSITFAMVAAEEIPTTIESIDNTIVRGVEKIVRDGQIFIRLQTQNGTILEYDIHGNQITTK